jgi:catechol 2,3-dioxygenase-like lactoylglutathione lyase family enzyme
MWCGRLFLFDIGRAEPQSSINDSQEITLTISSPIPDPAGLAEIAFATGDIDRFDRYLHERGVYTVPRKSDVGIAFDDPGGHHICIVQDDPPTLTYAHKVLGMRLVHAGFIVRNRDSMEIFYKDILGFHSYWHDGIKDSETNWMDMQVPDGTDWIDFMLNVRANADKQTLGIMNHIALGVPDVRAAAKVLESRGVKSPEKHQIGPDGTCIELMEFTPLQPPCCNPYTGLFPKP